MSDATDRLKECIAQHNRTGYSGVLKWAELQALDSEVEQLRQENESFHAEWDKAKEIHQKACDELAAALQENERLRRWMGTRWCDLYDKRDRDSDLTWGDPQA